MNYPKVSVIVSTYNRKDALELSLQALLCQTYKPDEILVADDGSKEDTKELVDKIRRKADIPIIHVWHPDEGFKLAAIRNKAIATATGEYIIQIDGDCLVDKHFVEDHLSVAQKGHFVRGIRLRISEEHTARLLSERRQITFWEGLRIMPENAFRCSLLRWWAAKYYARKPSRVVHLYGCNMAFWKEDILSVNGYDNSLTGWGHEDDDLAYRLYFNGVVAKSLKYGGLLYHLHHPLNSRANFKFHRDHIEKLKETRVTWCENGIDKYLNN